MLQSKKILKIPINGLDIFLSNMRKEKKKALLGRASIDGPALRRAVLKWIEPRKKTSTQKIAENTLPPVDINNKFMDVKEKNKYFNLGAFFCLSLLVALLVSVFASMYYFQPTGRISRFFVINFPLPVALVNWRPIYYSNWLEEVDKLNYFYARSLSAGIISDDDLFEQQDIRRHVLNRLIEEELIKQMAGRLNVNISSEEVNNYYSELVEEIGGQLALEHQLDYIYGWGPDEFKKNIVLPVILKRKIFQFYVESMAKSSRLEFNSFEALIANEKNNARIIEFLRF